MSLSILNNISALQAENQLSITTAAANKSLQQLSSGSRINSGSDDAAGLAISDGLNANVAALNQSSLNATNAVGTLQTADGALSQVTALLNRSITLATEASNSGLSTSQSAAINTEYQALLTQITSISNTTNFDGQRLIDGSLDYITSGVNTSAFSHVQINQANFGTSPNIPVNVDVITSAQQGELQLRASSIAKTVTVEINGNEGVDTLTFANRRVMPVQLRPAE